MTHHSKGFLTLIINFKILRSNFFNFNPHDVITITPKILGKILHFVNTACNTSFERILITD